MLQERAWVNPTPFARLSDDELLDLCATNHNWPLMSRLLTSFLAAILCLIPVFVSQRVSRNPSCKFLA